MRVLILLFFLVNTVGNQVQQRSYTPLQVHAHNDYVQPIPFLNAYSKGVGSIEADLFLKDNELYVAHEPQEIALNRTLEKMYLQPLQSKIISNKGNPYPKPAENLQLLLDIKTESTETLALLIKKLSGYPQIINNKNIRVVISGNRPAPENWTKYPPYIYFDGRPKEFYTPDQLKRVGLISDNIRNYTQWNGKNHIPENEKVKLQQMVDSVHLLNKNIRFWATPDNTTTWKTLMQLGVDYLGTDDVNSLTSFLKDNPTYEYKNKSTLPVNKQE